MAIQVDKLSLDNITRSYSDIISTSFALFHISESLNQPSKEVREKGSPKDEEINSIKSKIEESIVEPNEVPQTPLMHKSDKATETCKYPCDDLEKKKKKCE